MARPYSPPVEDRTQTISDGLYATGQWIGQNWQKGILIALAVFVILKKDVAINLQMQGGPHQGLAAISQGFWPSFSPASSTNLPLEVAPGPGTVSSEKSQGDLFSRLSSWIFGRSGKGETNDGHLANTYSHLEFSGSNAPASSREAKRFRQLSYVDHFARIAREESIRYGIPVSITLAQGLLESNAGYSNLATRNNNHFGIKCFSKSCSKGHCRNFSDDHHKDFFRIYSSPRESYRAHSELLQKSRYRHLKKLDPRDYKSWAKGLQRAGYATDPNYASKLIYIIENLGLDAYDS